MTRTRRPARRRPSSPSSSSPSWSASSSRAARPRRLQNPRATANPTESRQRCWTKRGTRCSNRFRRLSVRWQTRCGRRTTESRRSSPPTKLSAPNERRGCIARNARRRAWVTWSARSSRRARSYSRCTTRPPQRLRRLQTKTPKIKMPKQLHHRTRTLISSAWMRWIASTARRASSFSAWKPRTRRWDARLRDSAPTSLEPATSPWKLKTR